MSLKLLCKIFGGLSFISALSFLFMPDKFLEMSGMIPDKNLVPLAQAVGTAILFIGLLIWRTPDIAGDAMKDYAKLFGIGISLFACLRAYHIIIGIASGVSVYVDLGFNIIVAGLFFFYSKK